MIALIFAILSVLTLPARAQATTDINALVLQSIQEMPLQGNYSVEPESGFALMSALQISPPAFAILPEKAQPSFCSMGTYVVFLATIQKLLPRFEIPASRLKKLDVPDTIDSLFHEDGRGAWGRWNANGPGTARLFYALNLGKNFIARQERLPGDFVKIFFTDAVGKNERGHSVVYLGQRKNAKTGESEIQYWSSNQPRGYGRVWIPEKKVIHALYSRFQFPENLNHLDKMPEWDEYLRHLLVKPSSFSEAVKMSGVTPL